MAQIILTALTRSGWGGRIRYDSGGRPRLLTIVLLKISFCGWHEAQAQFIGSIPWQQTSEAVKQHGNGWQFLLKIHRFMRWLV